MGVIQRSLQVYRKAVLIDVLLVCICVFLAERIDGTIGIVAACFAGYFTMAAGINARSWVRVYKVSKSPYAFLLELEALSSTENGHEV